MIAMRYRSDSDAFCFSPPSALFPMLPSLLYLCSLVIHILRLLGSICNNLVLVSHHQKFVRNLSADMRLNVVLDAGVSVVASSVAHAEYLGCSTSITVHALGNVAVMPGICWGPISIGFPSVRAFTYYLSGAQCISCARASMPCPKWVALRGYVAKCLCESEATGSGTTNNSYAAECPSGSGAAGSGTAIISYTAKCPSGSGAAGSGTVNISDEISEVLAFIFTGSAAPTQEDFDRTPMLVRRHKVANALEWLKLNHEDYADLEISQENLMSYALHDIPVAVDFKRTEGVANDSIPAEARSVFDKNSEHGTIDGECTFAVHGLTGAEYSTASMSTIKAVALQHLTQKGDMLAIGRNDVPESMYHNLQAYPGMFPWLFPYGKGGIGHPTHKNKLADMTHKRNLLLYFDKRFQTDMYFPMVAFNQEQLKGSTQGSNILVKRSKFADISRRLLAMNPEVAANIADRMAKENMSSQKQMLRSNVLPYSPI
ncbi:hypothetical protein C8R47DRAFT_1313362 [Mycena vitilis]|nr:hypothetical protein C8R47DRAFT_1313362 [Mycena vitilis]